ncbi:hypothetical protein AADZ86_16710 [Colwelliaceae bacterium BS250]
MKYINGYTLILLILCLVGCQTTEDKVLNPNDYIQMEFLFGGGKDRQSKQCENIYRHNNLVVINTGTYWALYNPENGLLATGLLRKRLYRNNKLYTGEYVRNRSGIDFECSATIKLPINQWNHRQYYIQDAETKYEVKITKALDTISAYKSSNIKVELANELKLILGYFYDTGGYQNSSGFGNVIYKSSEDTFEDVVDRLLKNKQQKYYTYNKLNTEK